MFFFGYNFRPHDWPRSSTAEQLPLKQLVERSNRSGVTKKEVQLSKSGFSILKSDLCIEGGESDPGY